MSYVCMQQIIESSEDLDRKQGENKGRCADKHYKGEQMEKA